jgi:hypothetical protein
LNGRDFTPADQTGSPVAIVNPNATAESITVTGDATSVATNGPTTPSTTIPTPTTELVTATTSSDTVTTTQALSPTTAAEACADTFGTDSVSENFPQLLSGLVGRDVRTGAHTCFERVVIELQGTGDFPGYRVEYVPDPVRLSPSDLTVEIAGAATLVVSLGAWMSNTEGDGYAGPQQILPTNVQHIVELHMIENFEGMSMWAIGIDEQRGFRVSTLVEPPRIVVDIATPNS